MSNHRLCAKLATFNYASLITLLLLKSSPPPRTRRLVSTAIAMRLVVDTSVRLLYPYLPALSRGLGISLSAGGLLLALRSAMVFPSPLFGAWNDRRGPRGLLIAALLVQAASLAWLSLADGFWAALLPLALLGLSSAAIIPTIQAAISAFVPFQRRGRVIGIIEFSWALTGLAILPLIGLMIVELGWQTPLRLLAVLSLLVAPLPLLLPAGEQARQQTLISFRQMAATVWRSPSARAAILVNGLIFVAAESFFITYGAWLEQAFAMTPDRIGRIASLLGIAELIASASSSLLIDRLGKRRGVGLGLVAMTCTMLVLPLLAVSPALAVAGMAVFTLSFEWSIVSHISLLSEQVPLARGTVLSLAVMAGGATRTVSDYLAVALFERGGMTATALLGATGAAAAAWVLWRWVQEQANEQTI